MNKLLTLVNIELKRDAKFLILYLLGFFFLVLGINVYAIFNLSRYPEFYNSLMRSFGQITYGSSVLLNNIYILGIVGIGIIGLVLIYSVILWKSDYTDKSIYTLLMLPVNKFSVFISKGIAVITMVYTYLISMLIALFISKGIFNLVLKNRSITKTSLSTDLKISGIGSKIIPTHFVDFVMVYGVWLVLIISGLFTLYLIGLCLKESGLITVFIISAFPLSYAFFIARFSESTYKILGVNSIGNIGVDIILNLGMIILFNIISYFLVNKKLYI
ncbi:MAG: hypothetical protein ACRC92_05120 [Peptostreptococcaceae bacterium]